MHPGGIGVPVGEDRRRAGPDGEVTLDATLGLLHVVAPRVEKQVDVLVGDVRKMGLRVHPATKKKPPSGKFPISGFRLAP